jgi:hypothetical protein
MEAFWHGEAESATKEFSSLSLRLRSLPEAAFIDFAIRKFLKTATHK